MKERPILFSAPMVRAILEGRKTQTRRVVKDRHIDAAPPACFFQWLRERCPYGQPGDRLWVRETWNWFDPDEIPEVRRGRRAPFTGQQGAREIPWVAAYAADGHLEHEHFGCALWRPSIHMPRWASRILLEVTAVRVERLHEINAADAKSDGIEGQFEGGPWRNYQRDGHWFPEGKNTAPVLSYRTLWEKINGPGSWDANPWVWVVEFKRV